MPADLFGTPQAQAQASAPASQASITLQQNVASGGISFNFDMLNGPTPEDTSSNSSLNNTQSGLLDQSSAPVMQDASNFSDLKQSSASSSQQNNSPTPKTNAHAKAGKQESTQKNEKNAALQATNVQKSVAKNSMQKSTKFIKKAP